MWSGTHKEVPFLLVSGHGENPRLSDGKHPVHAEQLAHKHMQVDL